MRVFKALGVVAVLGSFFLVTSLIHLFWKRSDRRIAVLNRLVQMHCWMMARALNVRVRVQDMEESFAQGQGGALLAANHLSYVDAVVLFSLVSCRFVTSVEIGETPFLGWICKLAQCVFVERRNRRKMTREGEELVGSLESGHHVMVFPEGTSGNGDCVLPFKRRLVAAAVGAGFRVIPVCINYETVDEQVIDRTNRDRVFWYGSMTFGPHLWQLMGTKRIEMSVRFFPPLTDVDPYEAPSRARSLIENAFVSMDARQTLSP